MTQPFDSPDNEYALTMGIEAAQGYHELGMHAEAWSELEELEGRFPGVKEIAQTKISFFRDEKRWQEAIQKCESYCLRWPERPFGYINMAYCLHETGQTDEARLILEEGPNSLHGDARYHYNMGCYLAVLGETAKARKFLDRAFLLEKNLQEFARHDEDLKSIWNQI